MPRTTPEFQRQIDAHIARAARARKQRRRTVPIPTTEGRAEAAQAWSRLPARRRARMVAFLRDEAKERDQLARSDGEKLTALKAQLARRPRIRRS